MCWHLLVCSHRIYEVITATLGTLPLVQPPKSKPFTPLFSCVASAIHSAVLNRTRTTHASQPEFPAGVAGLAGVAHLADVARPGRGWCRSGAGPRALKRNGPRERWRWPKRARRGRPAGSEPV